MKYPKRDSFFAHRFVRLLTKTAAAQELGPEVVWLLTVVAHQEDAKRYRGAVTYWNEQLMPLCGFRSKGRLIRARQSAVDAGWLHYESGGRNQAGRYWCLVPDGFAQMPDGPCDESDPFHNRTANGTDEVQAFQNRTAIGTQTEPKRNSDGALSTLYPNPDPKEGAAASESGKRNGTSNEPVTIPDGLNTPEARQALEDWQQHRKELRKKLTPSAERALLRKWSKIGPARFIAAVEHSIENGWQGLFEPKTNGEVRERQPTGDDAAAVMEKHTAEVLARKREEQAAKGGPAR